jgi:hypothetical protein
VRLEFSRGVRGVAAYDVSGTSRNRDHAHLCRHDDRGRGRGNRRDDHRPHGHLHGIRGCPNAGHDVGGSPRPSTTGGRDKPSGATFFVKCSSTTCLSHSPQTPSVKRLMRTCWRGVVIRRRGDTSPGKCNTDTANAGLSEAMGSRSSGLLGAASPRNAHILAGRSCVIPPASHGKTQARHGADCGPTAGATPAGCHLTARVAQLSGATPSVTTFRTRKVSTTSCAFSAWSMCGSV